MPAPEHTLRAEAVVLRHSDWGEADRLLTLFTREQGKVRALAKGARKLRSRKAGHLEPFTRVKVMLAQGRDLWIVSQVETVDAYLPLRDNLVRTAYAAYLVELIDRFTYEEGYSGGLFPLLVDTLERIASLPDAFAAMRYAEIRLFDLTGFRPELFRCVVCGRQIVAEDQFFSPHHGGAVCPRCAEGLNNLRPVSMTTLKFLRHYQRSPYAEAMRIELPVPVGREMEALLHDYVTFVLERGLNTPSFLHEVREK